MARLRAKNSGPGRCFRRALLIIGRGGFLCALIDHADLLSFGLLPYDNFMNGKFKVEYLSAEEERTLARKYLRDGDIDARNRIALGFYPLIRSDAAKLAKKHCRDIEDVTHVGFALVLKRFHKFDPDRGFRASTYFRRGAYRAMEQFCKYRDRLIMAPENKVVPRLQKKVEQAARVAMFSQMMRAGNDEQGSELLDSLADAKATGSLEQIERQDDLDNMRRCFAELPERYRFVLKERMRGLMLHEIGKPLGLCKERIRQLEVQALHALRERMRALIDTDARCDYCERPFVRDKPKQRCCSQKCGARMRATIRRARSVRIAIP